ncbi:MAG TPA: hypothetical protein VEB69_12970 [Acidimicrobiia bacterium]|nr:hypothetical protein [Acidimicrobiia bacterium]
MTLPVTEYRPLNRRQLEELRGYVALSTTIGRVALFLVGVGIVSLLSWSFARQVTPRVGQWWPLVPLAFGGWLFRVSGGWTGGPEFRRRVKEDIVGGVAAVRRVSAVDAIEIEEVEDEGPSYFILTSDGQTLYIGFQELDRHKSRGFPWTEFEIVEAPNSGTFFSLKKIGGKLQPSLVRSQLPWDEMKQIGFDKRYRVLDVEFAKLKEQARAAKSR